LPKTVQQQCHGNGSAFLDRASAPAVILSGASEGQPGNATEDAAFAKAQAAAMIATMRSREAKNVLKPGSYVIGEDGEFVRAPSPRSGHGK
jgi:hypothetical protein